MFSFFCLRCCCFFFFKQKTAYEMRISDGSSDVCSSDLPRWRSGAARPRRGRNSGGGPPRRTRRATATGRSAGSSGASLRHKPDLWLGREVCACGAAGGPDNTSQSPTGFTRSEEHTSELQSLMRLSYAVFRLKKKNHKTTKHSHNL